MKYAISVPVLCLLLGIVFTPNIASAGVGKFIGNVIFKEGGKIMLKSAAKGFASEFGTQVGKKAATTGLAILASKYPPKKYTISTPAMMVDGRALYYESAGVDTYNAFVGKSSTKFSYKDLMLREYELMTPAQRNLFNSYFAIVNNYMQQQQQEINNLHNYGNVMMELFKGYQY